MLLRAFVALLLVSATASAQTVFLDNHPGVVNGSATYDPETRTCGTGSHMVFTKIDEAAQALANADVLYVRAGTYSRDSVGKYIEVHGHRVNYWTGALAITASGTPGKRKLVSAYKDERVVIQASPGVSAYNPDPDDTTFKNSSHYYPNPAISVHGSYVDLVGFKTYGQVVIARHDVTLQGCDLGGGGPHMNQGNVVVANGYGAGAEPGVYNVVIRNNRIHHSCWGEHPLNGSAVMCYWASFTIEHNEFYDNVGGDIRVKDCKNQQGRDVIIRYNFFGPSSLSPSWCGVSGMNQARHVDHIRIHNNIFHDKPTGILWDGPARISTVAYNNTFINCRGKGATSGDVADWQNGPINLYNNLYYHSQPDQKFYDLQTEPWSKLHSDYNLFFSVVGDTKWLHQYRARASDLEDWRKYSGRDQHSVCKDPVFVNLTGSRPEDFKRRGNPRDVTGSPYGPVCGAYVTGDEVVGIVPGQNRWHDTR